MSEKLKNYGRRGSSFDEPPPGVLFYQKEDPQESPTFEKDWLNEKPAEYESDEDEDEDYEVESFYYKIKDEIGQEIYRSNPRLRDSKIETTS
jgi:hypothetical protein